MIYTLGYAGWTLPALCELVERLGGLVVDVRMSPRSRHPHFTGKALREALGDRYVHVRAFGNELYKTSRIRLVDFEAGAEALERMARRPVILLCACGDVTICHRRLVAERLARRWQTEVIHLTPGEQHERSSGYRIGS